MHVGLWISLAVAGAQRRRDRVGAQLGSSPLVERIENDEHRAEVRAVGPEHERHAGDADGVGDALRVLRTISSALAITSSVRSSEAESGSWIAANR